MWSECEINMEVIGGGGPLGPQPPSTLKGMENQVRSIDQQLLVGIMVKAALVESIRKTTELTVVRLGWGLWLSWDRAVVVLAPCGPQGKSCGFRPCRVNLGATGCWNQTGEAGWLWDLIGLVSNPGDISWF